METYGRDPNPWIQRQIEEALRIAKAKQAGATPPKVRVTPMADEDRAAAGDIAKAGMDLADKFAAANGQSLGWASDLAYPGAPLASYYDPATKKLTLTAGLSDGEALNELATRKWLDALDASGKYNELRDYALKSMAGPEASALASRYNQIYNGEYSGKALDDIVNRETTAEWARKNLFGNSDAVRMLAVKNPQLFAALQDANDKTLLSVDGVDGLGAVGGQFKQVAANYANAARGAAIDQAMKAGRQPYLPMTDLGMMADMDEGDKSGEEKTNNTSSPTSTSAPSPTPSPIPTPTPTATAMPGPTPEPTKTTETIPTKPEPGPAPSSAPTSGTNNKEPDKSSGADITQKSDSNKPSIPIIGPDGAPDSYGINPKTGNLNIGGYDLSEKDITSISNFLYIGYTPEQSALIFLKLKQNGEITGQELLDMGAAKKPTWFERLTGQTPDGFASLISTGYRLGQDDDTSFAEIDSDERQQRFSDALGVIAFAGSSSKSNGNRSKIAEEEMGPFKFGNREDYFWGRWDDYKKVTIDKEYAQVGKRLYTKHAMLRIQPSGRRYKQGGAIVNQISDEKLEGRSISPRYVEDIIKSTKPVEQAERKPGEGNTYKYSTGNVDVILNKYGAVVSIVIND